MLFLPEDHSNDSRVCKISVLLKLGDEVLCQRRSVVDHIAFSIIRSNYSSCTFATGVRVMQSQKLNIGYESTFHGLGHPKTLVSWHTFRLLR